MNTTQLFEVFNHCATQKDPDQILALADSLQVLCSSILSDGKIYYGEDAPGAFRSAFQNFCKDPGEFNIRVKHRAGGNKNAIYVTDLRHQGRLATSALNFGITGENWVSFVQTTD